MADTKTTDLGRIFAPASGDFVMLVDKSTTSMSSDGTNVKITFGDMHGGASAADIGVLTSAGEGRPLTSGELGLLKGLTGGTIQAQFDSVAAGYRSVAGDTENGIVTWVTADNTFASESNLTFDGTTLTLGSAAIIEAELEILDGATVTTGELNILDGVTSTAADLNIIANAGAGRPLASGEVGLLKGLTGGTLQSQLAAIESGKHDTIDASSRLSATLIGADGNVSNTEYGYLASVTKDIQTQFNTIGAASGTFTNTTGDAIANGVTATTQSSSDNSTKIATTAYADAAGGGGGHRAERVLISDGAGASAISPVTSGDLQVLFHAAAGANPLSSGELGLLKGLTGGTLQSQLAAKHATIDASSRLDATLIGANGNVSNTEYGYLSSLTADIQTQLNTVGAASGTFTNIIGNALADGVTATTQSSSDNSTKVATTAYADAAGGGGTPTGSGVVSECTGRLTGQSATYVSTTDQTTLGTVYFCGPTGGNFRTWLWTPNKYTEWVSGQLSLSMSGLASKPYDIWIYDNSGTPTLAHTVWTDGTNRATALEMDNAGVIHKNNARTHRYLGTIYLYATGTFRDAGYSRGIWNLHNRRLRHLVAPLTNGYWTYNSSTIRAANANSTLNEMRCDWVQGMNDNEVNLVYRNGCGWSATGWGWIGVGIDSTSSDSAQINCGYYVSTDSRWGTVQSEYRGYPGIGYHYGQCLESSPTTGSITLYYYGEGGNDFKMGMIGSIMC